MKPAVGEVYYATECPRGELGYHLISDGSKKPYRLKVKSPCFISIASMDEVCSGMMIADLVAYIGSIDIVLGEVDR
jgi:NADH-quinone oxidoreductase subunit D